MPPFLDFDVVIRNALIATASDTYFADIGIVEGKVQQIGTALAPGRRDIDAAGRVVTPGGVDAHCHLDQPMAPPVKLSDDFFTGTRSAACGGTTTVIPFAAQMRGQNLQTAIDDYHQRAHGRACVDYAFHLILTDPRPDVLKDLPRLIAAGYTSFKLYMTYEALKLTDGQILDVLDVVRTHGGMPMIHAENADCIAWLTRKLEAAGRTAPRYHATSRPLLVEREAAHRAISLAELVDTPILLVHVSGSEAVDQIRQARAQGLNVYAETCPQYILLTEADLGTEANYFGARCVCSPPPRDKSSHEAIWQGLADGLFSVFSSDHSPFNLTGEDGKTPGGEEVRFRHIPNGIPGIETRLPLLYSEGVLGGRISVNKFVELTATHPARMYGLYPRKGTIAIGSDADLVIWDARNFRLSNDDLHHACDYSPYEGMTLNAWPAMTLLRGEVVWDGKTFSGHAGAGEFVVRGLPSIPRISARAETPTDWRTACQVS
jgi:dihydropyrimidinase